MRKSSYLELLCLTTFGAYVGFYMDFVQEVVWGYTSNMFSDGHRCSIYCDYIHTGWKFRRASWVGSAALFTGSFKLIKFASLNTQAEAILRPLGRASKTLLSFGIVFAVVWIGAAWVVVVVYGSRMVHAHSMFRAMLFLFRLMLGNDEDSYSTMSRIAPNITPLLYFCLEVWFIVLSVNMLIAIILSEFEVVKRDASHEERWKQEVPSIFHDVGMVFRTKTFRCRAQYTCQRNRVALKMTESIAQTRRLYAQDPEKWGPVYETVANDYWRGHLQLQYWRKLRHLAHIAKNTSTGPTINLLLLLEKLYNSWQERSLQAVDASEGGTVPILMLSGNRLFNMISNPPPHVVGAQHEREAANHTNTQRPRWRRVCHHSFLWWSSCRDTKIHQQMRREQEFIRGHACDKGLAVVVECMNLYHQMSETVLVAPVVTDIDFWTNDESVSGELLRLDLDNPRELALLFQASVSVSGRAASTRTIYVDRESAQLYVVSKMNLVDGSGKHFGAPSIQHVRRDTARTVRGFRARNPLHAVQEDPDGLLIKGSNPMIRSLPRSKSGHSISSELSVVNEDDEAAEKDAEKDTERPGTGISPSSPPRDQLYRVFENGDGDDFHRVARLVRTEASSATATTSSLLYRHEGGRIKRVVDLLALQQLHVDKVDLLALNMFFDDGIGASLSLRFDTYERRNAFLRTVLEVAESMLDDPLGLTTQDVARRDPTEEPGGEGLEITLPLAQPQPAAHTEKADIRPQQQAQPASRTNFGQAQSQRNLRTRNSRKQKGRKKRRATAVLQFSNDGTARQHPTRMSAGGSTNGSLQHAVASLNSGKSDSREQAPVRRLRPEKVRRKSRRISTRMSVSK